MPSWTQTRIDVDDTPRSTTGARQVATTVGMLSQGASRFGVNVLIGRLGGAATLGTVASAVSLAQVFTLLWPAGNAAAASKFIPRARGNGDYETVRAIAGHLARTALLTASLLAVLAAGTWLVAFNEFWPTAVVPLLLVLGYSGQATVNGLSYATGQHPTAAKWDIAAAGCSLLGVGLMLLAGVQGIALAVPLALAAIAQTALRWPKGTPGGLDEPLRREINTFVAIGTIGTLSSAGFLQLSLIAAALTEGRSGAGQFAAALVLATPLLIMVASMTTVMYPAIAEALGRSHWQDVREITAAHTRVIGLAMIGVTGGVSIASPALVDFVWGADFERAIGLFPILAGGVLAGALASPSVNFLMNHSQRDAALATGLSVAASACGVAWWVVMAPSGGLTAVAWGYLLGKGLFAIAVISVASSRLHFLTWVTSLRHILGIGAATAAVVWVRVSDLEAPQQLGLGTTFLVAWLVLSRADLSVATKMFATRSGDTHSTSRSGGDD